MCDWGGDKKGKGDDDDDGAGKKKIVKQCHQAHYLATQALQRSRHFPDLYLTVGDWAFHVWRTGMDVPVRVATVWQCR